MSTNKKKACLFIPFGLVILCIEGIAISSLSNTGLPQHSTCVDHLGELEITRLADAGDDYLPVENISHDKDFHNYQGQQQFWSTQLKEEKNTQERSGDTRFYYSGNTLAVLLDRLMPGWKPRALPGGEYLVDLLQEAVQ